MSSDRYLLSLSVEAMSAAPSVLHPWPQWWWPRDASDHPVPQHIVLTVHPPHVFASSNGEPLVTLFPVTSDVTVGEAELVMPPDTILHLAIEALQLRMECDAREQGSPSGADVALLEEWQAKYAVLMLGGDYAS